MVSHFAVSLQWKLQQFFKISDFNKSFKEAVRNFKELQTPQIRKIELALPNDIFDFKVKQIDEDKNDDEDMPSQTDNLPGTNEAENITTARMLEYHRRDGYFQSGLYIGLQFIRYFVLMLQTMAQMGLVPLMLLLFLDSYAWICIIGDKYYRGERSEYELSLDQKQ